MKCVRRRQLKRMCYVRSSFTQNNNNQTATIVVNKTRLSIVLYLHDIIISLLFREKSKNKTKFINIRFIIDRIPYRSISRQRNTLFMVL